MLSFLLFLGLSFFLEVSGRRDVTTFEINLDISPEHRYDALLPQFNETVWGFYRDSFEGNTALTDVLYGLSDKRGLENDEQQAEIEGLARESKLPLDFVKSIQMLYELQTIMVPIVNLTGSENTLADYLPEEYKVLADLPWRGPGCTGIIAMNAQDKSVYHARNLDFSPVDVMTNLVYNGVFTKGGKEVFRSQMVAGYTMAITGYKPGKDGYAIERNTRYTDHKKGFYEMIQNLISGRPLNGWTVRQVLMTESTFDGAIQALDSAKYASSEYAIVSGVKKGVILSKNPEYTAFKQTLGEKNFDERDDYIIMTNFDFFWKDLREYFDPTGGQIGHPRRIAAQKLLNATEEGSLDGETLFNVINAQGVLADTIFQAIINVELDIWNISLPDIPDERE